MRPIHEFAIRFDPPNHEHRVPLDVYVPAMNELREGFVSLRASVAPLLAKRRNISRTLVQEALVVYIRANAPGSNLALLDIGPKRDASQRDFDFYPMLPDVFWKYGGDLLSGAARDAESRTSASISATCAEHFARAADIAANDNIGLQLTERSVHAGNDAIWRQTVDLTSAREGLRRYATRRREQQRLTTQLIGRVVEICSSPLHLKLQTPEGRLLITSDARLSKQIQAFWNRDVIVTVDSLISADGEMTKPHLLDIEPVVQSTDFLADYMNSRGAGRDLWSGDDAEEYLQSLRGGDA